jgi:hypothetical protein
MDPDKPNLPGTGQEPATPQIDGGSDKGDDATDATADAESVKVQEPAAASSDLGSQIAQFKSQLFSPEAKSLVAYYFIQVRYVLLHPKQFFAEMPTQGGYVEPLMFLGITAAIYAILQAIGHLNFVLMIKLFLTSTVSVIVGAFFTDLILRRFGGKGNRESTFRVLAYAKAPLLFAWIHLGMHSVGGVAATVYTLVLAVIGLKRVHELSGQVIFIVLAVLTALGLLVKGL